MPKAMNATLDVDMRLPLILAVMGLGLGMASPALARNVSISGTHSAGEIKATCAREGGTYSHDVQGDYQCAKGPVVVACTKKGKCIGYGVDRRIPAGALGGMLGPATGFSRATTGAEPTRKVRLPTLVAPIGAAASRGHRGTSLILQNRLAGKR